MAFLEEQWRSFRSLSRHRAPPLPDGASVPYAEFVSRINGFAGQNRCTNGAGTRYIFGVFDKNR